MDQQLDPELLASAKSYWELLDQNISQEALEGNQNTLDTTIITSIWATIGEDIPYHPILLDYEIHSFWNTVRLAASSFDAHHPKQDLILRHILAAREIGALTREAEEVGQKPVLALTSNGQRLWTDLPLLVQDFHQFWRTDSMKMLPGQRKNLAAFIARLASVGVCDDQLASCALLLFRDTFETPRRLVSADSGSEVPVEDLLPAVAAWVEFAPHKIRDMVKRRFNKFSDAEAADVGNLVSHGGVSQNGFNPSRWTFWKQRLAEFDQSGKVPEASRILQVLDSQE